MKNFSLRFLLISFLAICYQVAVGQCVWQTVFFDGFEYTTPVQGLIPGKTVHTTPQSYAVLNGSYSLYMNFTTCTGGTGACAGDKIYERRIPACPFQRYRFSTWLTTSFSGTQSNVKITISDNQGNILDNQLQILAPYYPSWIQYQSAEVIPQADTLIFTLYTNVPGVQSGNDLSMDDLLFEKCFGPYTSTNPLGVCDNVTGVSLYNSIPYQSNGGIWSGASALSGGYLGIYDPSVNAPGNYIYTSYPFTNACPQGFDTVVTSNLIAPAPDLGTDTTLCATNSLLLNPGTDPGYMYMWNNGVTGPQVLAFAQGSNPVTNVYAVTVTDNNGCVGIDSITVDFVDCTGISDPESSQIYFYPNPAGATIKIYSKDQLSGENYELVVSDLTGRIVFIKAVSTSECISLNKLERGIYFFQLLQYGKQVASQKITVTDLR